MCFATDLHESLVQVPAPVRIRTVMFPPIPDIRGEHRAEPVSPETRRLVADVDAALKQQILDLARRKRIAKIHHCRETDDLG